MKKTPADAPGDDTPPAADAPIDAATTPEEQSIADEGSTEGEQLFDPNHKWPTAGGCYVRQTDGSLTRED